jgi:hypothetical protein
VGVDKNTISYVRGSAAVVVIIKIGDGFIKATDLKGAIRGRFSFRTHR